MQEKEKKDVKKYQKKYEMSAQREIFVVFFYEMFCKMKIFM